tara:strand:+ start:459 stop:887 length:429 start_codon:yes stop_codon:yes gene_type:complete
MFYISHRGNVDGIKKSLENNPEYIKYAIKLGFDVEVDVRTKNKKFYLGHDEPLYHVSSTFLKNKKIWCHAKTSEALSALKKIKAHYFWHQKDDYTITSKGYFWTYPGKKLLKNSICVLPEKFKSKVKGCSGICSDYIKNYKK